MGVLVGPRRGQLSVRDVSAFHPELRGAARLLPRHVVGPRLLPIARRLEARARRRPPPPDVEVVPTGSTTVRLHRPPAGTPAPWPAVLWIHGGGYVIGTAAQDDAACRELAVRLGALVASPDYRLAPEHPFPGALEDCHDALVGLAGRADVDADRVAIGGGSAGGGLAASLALLARDRGQVAPVFQALVYPMLDDRTALRRERDDAEVRLWDNRSNRFGWTSYLGTAPGTAAVDPVAVPARHPDLAGLAPAWIGVGTLDLFHDEDVAYAERLRAAGVPCQLEVVEGAFHAFDAMRPGARVVQEHKQSLVRALEDALRR